VAGHEEQEGRLAEQLQAADVLAHESLGELCRPIRRYDELGLLSPTRVDELSGCG
jgi:hypothetical protein